MFSLTMMGTPCNGPRTAPTGALIIELLSYINGVWVDLCDCMESAIELIDPSSVGVHEIDARKQLRL